jgi:two-component system chemotaxis response regulator CheY
VDPSKFDHDAAASVPSRIWGIKSVELPSYCRGGDSSVTERILIVDDSVIARRMLRQALERGGYVVEDAPSAEVALTKLTSTPIPALIVSDVNMDGLSGLQLLAQIRERYTRIDLPVLMLTTEGSVEMRGEGRRGGANGWIVKPFDPETLLGLVDKVITGAKALREGA